MVSKESHTAKNYNPLNVEIATAEEHWVTDVNGVKYLDFLAGYSALNFGHRHPDLIAAAEDQMNRVTLVPRAFRHDQLDPFTEDLSKLTGKDKILPMNTGAEAVETALKVGRKWGYEVKGIPEDQANIIVASQNFHGRTISIVGFSSDPDTYRNFGPKTPGFRSVTFGDISELEAAIDDNTAAVMFEPIQGEAGVIIPPAGYMQAVRELCSKNKVLFMADEIQSGLGRTGKTFALEHEGVEPDVYILGKALGGGLYPVSAVAGNKSVIDVIKPGEHGSTFGGNPMAGAIGRAVIKLLNTGEYQHNAEVQGAYMAERLNRLVGRGVTEVRARGLWAGIDIDKQLMTGRAACEALMRFGVLAYYAHGSTIRFSPPLTVGEKEIDFATGQLQKVLDIERHKH